MSRSQPSEVDRQLDEILFRCLERPEEEWEKALAEACDAHGNLAPRLEERFSTLRAFGMTASDPSRPTRIGDYDLLRPIGGGSMGTVFLARRQGHSDLVAVKILRTGLRFSEPARRRFARELEIVAKLRHPGICEVRETSESDGVPYLAMEYVEGESLNRRIALASGKGKRPDAGEVPAILQIIEGVARALHAAHAAGLVHRDIKPGNIMVRTNGDPVLLDFGLARDVEDAGSKLTISGSLLGSPAYLSPEAIEGRAPPDAQGDVYALGVTLFESLTHELPFTAPTKEALFHRILRDPVPDPRRKNPCLSREVATVVGAAMAKDPRRRYGSAEALADDLKAARHGEAVSVHPPGLIETCASWVRRNPLLAGFVLVLLVGLSSTAWLLREVSSGMRRMRALGLANVAANVEPQAGVLLGRRAVELLEHPVTVSQLHAAVARYHYRDVYGLDNGQIFFCGFRPDGAGIVSQSGQRSVRIFDASRNIQGEITDVARAVPGPGPDEVLLLFKGGPRDGGAFLWRAGAPELALVIEDGVMAIQVVGEETLVVAMAEDGAAALHRSGASRPVLLPRMERPWVHAEIAASGQTLFLMDGERFVFVDTGGKVLASVPGRTVPAYSEDGYSFVIEDASGQKAWYKVASDARSEPLSPIMQFGPKADAFRFSPTADLLAVREEQLSLRVCNTKGQTVGIVPDHGVFIGTFAFSPDGRYLATGDGDAIARLYTVQGSLVSEFYGHHGHVTSLAFNPEGEKLATGSYDRQVRVFWVRPGSGHLLDGSRAHIIAVDTAEDSRVLWVDGGGELWLKSGTGTSQIGSSVHRAVFVGGGDQIMVCDREGGCSIIGLDGAERAFLGVFPGEKLVDDFSASPGGDWIVGVSHGGQVCLWKQEGQKWAIASSFETDARLLLRSADVSAGGQIIACAGGERDCLVHIYNIEGQELMQFPAHDVWIWSVRFSPSGDALLTTSRDNSARLWPLEGGHLGGGKLRVGKPVEFGGHDGTIARGVFSPDGTLVATASTDHTVRLWARDGHLRAVLRGHRGQVWGVAFSSDGEYVVSGAYDRQVRVWPVRTERLLRLARDLVDRQFTPAERELYGEYLGAR